MSALLLFINTQELDMKIKSKVRAGRNCGSPPVKTVLV
jgi:hypothetical protein